MYELNKNYKTIYTNNNVVLFKLKNCYYIKVTTNKNKLLVLERYYNLTTAKKDLTKFIMIY